jgi:hypothetical protein
MRRGFSIFLILLFGLGPLSAMVPGSEDASLPSCCRRNGAHHCAMAAMARTPDPKPHFTVPLTCPYYPGPALAMLMPAHALTAAAASPHVAMARSFAPILLCAAAFSTAGRTHAGRGPPLSNLS